MTPTTTSTATSSGGGNRSIDRAGWAMRCALAALAVALGLGAAGCGTDGDDDGVATDTSASSTTTNGEPAAPSTTDADEVDRDDTDEEAGANPSLPAASATGDGTGTTATTPTTAGSTSAPTTAPSSSTTAASSAETDPTGEGLVAIQLEPVDGYFIEGFEIGLRIETAAGDPIVSTLWTSFVDSLPGEATIDAYYDSVLEQPVPAGEVVVLATANIGAGPPPAVPDLDGDFACRLPVSVEPGQVVVVEVRFTGPDCLVRMEG